MIESIRASMLATLLLAVSASLVAACDPNPSGPGSPDGVEVAVVLNSVERSLTVVPVGDGEGSFELFDDTLLAVSRNGDQITLTRVPGTTFDGAGVFEVERLGQSVAAVGVVGGDALDEVADEAALVAAESGYVMDWPRARMLGVKLPAGEQSAVITFVEVAP